LTRRRDPGIHIGKAGLGGLGRKEPLDVTRKLLRLLVAVALAVLPLALLSAGAARAQIPESGPRSDGPPESTLRNLFGDSGDPYGSVAWLSERGVEIRLSYLVDVLGNVQGGRRRGWINQGLFEPSMRVDFEKLAGLPALRAYANAFITHNTGRMLRDHVGSVNTIAAIEAMPRARLSEAWLEQGFAGDTLRLRAGQLAADVEFFHSDLSVNFLQSDFPTIGALNLPGGGPAFPLATPGVFLQYEPHDRLDLRVAMFNGQVSRPRAEEPEIDNRYNTLFRVRDPALFFAEARLNAHQAADATGLARSLRLGGWTHLARFDHQRLAAEGRLLADPLSSGVPLRRRGSAGLYAVLDQQLWRPAGGDNLSGISVFARVSISPSDRSVIGTYLDGGVVFADVVPGRPKDRFGLGVIHARFAHALRRFDADQIALGLAPPGSMRRSETSLEMN
jgi:porin